MEIPTYLKNKKNKPTRIVLHIQKQFFVGYQEIHINVINRFIRWKHPEFLLINNSITNTIHKYAMLFQLRNKKNLSGKAKANTSDRISWTRRRFNGELLSITIRSGLITEKVYVTQKGSLITVKRDELGILSNLFLHS